MYIDGRENLRSIDKCATQRETYMIFCGRDFSRRNNSYDPSAHHTSRNSTPGRMTCPDFHQSAKNIIFWIWCEIRALSSLDTTIEPKGFSAPRGAGEDSGGLMSGREV